MSALAQYLAAGLGVIMLGAIYGALDRAAHALERQATAIEQWHGEQRTALMFPDDPPHEPERREHWRPDQDPRG